MVKAERYKIQGHPWLYSKFETSLGYMRLFLKKKKNPHIHLPAYPLTIYTLIYTYIHALVYLSSTQLLPPSLASMHSFIRLCVNPCTYHLCAHPCTQPCITHPCVCLSIICLCIHSASHLSIIHLYTRSHIHPPKLYSLVTSVSIFSPL